ncbi:MAG TPA: DUF5658 family protein [Bryobacteraceae bacterium]|nr:DUF5658 family protein [Bryobacteraceae bacterium]
MIGVPNNAVVETRGRMNQLLVQYSYLQVLDFLTTIAFLLNGVQEGNPVVRLFVQASSNPIGGLVAVKALAVLLGIYCWRMGKVRLLGRINWMFAALVAWNLVALILGSVHHAA